MMKNITITIIFLSIVAAANAQQALTIYNMDIVGQSAQYNPSLLPANRMYIGIPALSTTTVLFSNSGFTWRDLHKVRTDDSVSIDIDNAISKLSDNNLISFSIRSNIFEAGFKVKKTHFNLNVTEHANLNFTFPKELFELLLKGNGAFIGREVDLSTLSLDITHYREYAAGFARQLSKKVTVGARAKYLYGMENISTVKSNLSLYTAPDDYALELNSEYAINTSMTANDTTGNTSNYALGMKNTGLAGDLSVTYDLTERWKINASIIDVGYIKWKSNVKNLVTPPGTYNFEGIDIAEFMSDSSSSMNNVTDSLSDAFTPKETNEAYTTHLPTHIYLNAAYRINERYNAAFLAHAMTFKGSMQPTFTASINGKLTNHFSASISYSVINHHFDNVGAGLVVHMGAVQLYVISENWIGTINPLSNHTSHFQFGVNLIFGRPSFKKKASPLPSVTAIPAEFVK